MPADVSPWTKLLAHLSTGQELAMHRAQLKYFLFVKFLVLSLANDNILVRDYFVYRGTSHVVGFSCADLESNFNLVKAFSSHHATLTIWNEKSASRYNGNLTDYLNADYHRLGIFVDSRCETTRNYASIITDASKSFMYDEMHKWLIFGSSLKEAVEFLEDSTYSIYTDVVLAIPSSNGYILYDVYNPCKERGGLLNVTEFGTWHEKTGVYITLLQDKYSRRVNFHGLKMKVGVALDHKPPAVSYEDYLSDHDAQRKDRRTKFLYILLRDMADMYNFTMEVVEVPNPKKLVGPDLMSAAFRERYIDVSATPLSMEIEGFDHGEIIAPVWPLRASFLFRTISMAQLRMTQFLQPFAANTWYAIILMLVVGSLVLVAIIPFDGIARLPDGCGLSIILVIGTLAQQDADFVPSTVAGRIAFLQLMLFSVLILNYYSADVTKDRLLSIGDKMNDSLYSLSRSDYILGVEPDEYIKSLLQSTDPDLKDFYDKRLRNVPESELYVPLEEGLMRAYEGGFAYLSTIEHAYPLVERFFEFFMIYELTEVHLRQTILALWARRNSPLTDILRVGLIKCYNVGLRARQINKWGPRKPFRPQNMFIAYALSIYETIPALAFLAMGIALALAFCILENIVSWAIKKVACTLYPRLNSSKLKLLHKSTGIEKVLRLKGFEDFAKRS